MCQCDAERTVADTTVRLFGLGNIGEQNFDVKRKQSQQFGMDSVTGICKYHFLCFVTIIQLKVFLVTSGHQDKKVKQKKSGFRTVIHVCRSDFRKERKKMNL